VTSCANLSDVTGSISAPNQMPGDEQGIRAFTQAWGQRYDKNPKDKTSAIVRRRMIWNSRANFGSEVIGSSGLSYAA
jgi:hypothetical protein